MKKEYDCAKAEQGKFYNKNAMLQIPIYLEPELLKYFNEIVRRKNININALVNDTLRQYAGLSE